MNISFSRTIILFIMAFASMAATSAYACGECEYEVCANPILRIECLCPHIPGCNKTGIPPGIIPGLGSNDPSPADKAIQDAEATFKKAVDDIWRTISKGNEDANNTLNKTNEDFKAEATRAGKNVEEAVGAIGRYIDREGQNAGKTLSHAEQRLREGKVVDAIWHMGIEPMQGTEDNAAKAAQESELIRTVGQAAATAYGGPGGAAGYAAWLTYKQTGDANLALRVGIISGAASAAFGKAGKLPSEEAYQLAQKAVVTGAIGGIAVAAAGGSEEAIKAGFLQAGSMILVQDGYRNFTGHTLDARASEGEGYCMTTGLDCSPPEGAILEKSADGKTITKIDMSKVNPRTPAVGLKVDPAKVSWQSEQSPFMTSISRIPGMQAMAVFHDTWTMSWDSDLLTKASIVPAVVLTYTGTGAPFYENVRRTAIDKSLATTSRPPSLQVGEPEPQPRKPTAPVIDQALTLPVDTSSINVAFMCTQGEHTKFFKVQLGGSKAGFACKLTSNRDGAISTPWSAKHQKDFCMHKAEQLATSSVHAGWKCFEGSKAQQDLRTARIAASRPVTAAINP